MGWAEVANRAVPAAIFHPVVVSRVEEVVDYDLRLWSLVMSLTEPKTGKPGSSWRLKKLYNLRSQRHARTRYGAVTFVIEIQKRPVSSPELCHVDQSTRRLLERLATGFGIIAKFSEITHGDGEILPPSG